MDCFFYHEMFFFNMKRGIYHAKHCDENDAHEDVEIGARFRAESPDHPPVERVIVHVVVVPHGILHARAIVEILNLHLEETKSPCMKGHPKMTSACDIRRPGLLPSPPPHLSATRPKWSHTSGFKPRPPILGLQLFPTPTPYFLADVIFGWPQSAVLLVWNIFLLLKFK